MSRLLKLCTAVYCNHSFFHWVYNTPLFASHIAAISARNCSSHTYLLSRGLLHGAEEAALRPAAGSNSSSSSSASAFSRIFLIQRALLHRCRCDRNCCCRGRARIVSTSASVRAAAPDEFPYQHRHLLPGLPTQTEAAKGATLHPAHHVSVQHLVCSLLMRPHLFACSLSRARAVQRYIRGRLTTSDAL